MTALHLVSPVITPTDTSTPSIEEGKYANVLAHLAYRLESAGSGSLTAHFLQHRQITPGMLVIAVSQASCSLLLAAPLTNFRNPALVRRGDWCCSAFASANARAGYSPVAEFEPR